MNREQFLDDVVDAFINKNIIPTRGSWGNVQNKKCCGIGAISVSLGITSRRVNYVKEIYNLSRDYTLGFMYGFDGYDTIENTSLAFNTEEGNLGFEDGKKVWEKVNVAS